VKGLRTTRKSETRGEGKKNPGEKAPFFGLRVYPAPRKREGEERKGERKFNCRRVPPLVEGNEGGKEKGGKYGGPELTFVEEGEREKKKKKKEKCFTKRLPLFSYNLAKKWGK